MAERIVEFKALIVNELGDAIDFILAVMDDNFRIRHGDNINLTTGFFCMENRTFLNAYVDLELVCRDVLFYRKKTKDPV